MTNEQCEKLEILSRIDELDRLETITDDPKTLKVIKERKKDLRAKLSRLA